MIAERIDSTAPGSTMDDEAYYRRLWRSMAAKDGWETRRAGMTPGRRLVALRHHVADAPARLLCADLCERIALPIYLRSHPDDPRPAFLLHMARRYARGEASERERLGARQIAIAMDAAFTEPLHLLPPDGKALEAIIWCLNKPTVSMLWSVERWLDDLLDAAGQAALLAELVAALEMMPQRPRRQANYGVYGV